MAQHLTASDSSSQLHWSGSWPKHMPAYLTLHILYSILTFPFCILNLTVQLLQTLLYDGI
jgi:hypothetical protein